MSHTVELSKAKSKSWNIVALNLIVMTPVTVISVMAALTLTDCFSVLSASLVSFEPLD